MQDETCKCGKMLYLYFDLVEAYMIDTLSLRSHDRLIPHAFLYQVSQILGTVGF